MRDEWEMDVAERVVRLGEKQRQADENVNANKATSPWQKSSFSSEISLGTRGPLTFKSRAFLSVDNAWVLASEIHLWNLCSVLVGFFRKKKFEIDKNLFLLYSGL